MVVFGGVRWIRINPPCHVRSDNVAISKVLRKVLSKALGDLSYKDRPEASE